MNIPIIQSLRRLLLAFSMYSPAIGYCQSLNYIAGMLLLFMSEEEAFWTFVMTITEILPPNIYDVTMEGANIDQNVLMILISERYPQLWNRISGGKSFWECEEDGTGMPTCSLVTSHWFLTLYINILPIEVRKLIHCMIECNLLTCLHNNRACCVFGIVCSMMVKRSCSVLLWVSSN
jgi:hypothetical protein